MPEIGNRIGRSHLLIAGVAALLAFGAVFLVLRPTNDTPFQPEAVVETVSNGTFSFATTPGEGLVEAGIIETRVVEIIDSVGTSDNMTETVTRRAVSGWLPTEIQSVTVKFRLDRDSRTYVFDLPRFMVADEIRHGYFAFPPNVEPDMVYPIWIEEMFQPLNAVYVGTAEIENLSVLEFAISETNTALWADTHASIARRTGDAHITYFVEPHTGIIVDQSYNIVELSLDQFSDWLVTFEVHTQFSPETVQANIARTQTLLDQQGSTAITTIEWTLLGIAPLLLVATLVRTYLRHSATAHSVGQVTRG